MKNNLPGFTADVPFFYTKGNYFDSDYNEGEKESSIIMQLKTEIPGRGHLSLGLSKLGEAWCLIRATLCISACEIGTGGFGSLLCVAACAKDYHDCRKG
jgi:hypothetical protein